MDVGTVGLEGQRATFVLDGRAETVPLARRFVTAQLRRLGLDELASDAAVVATELVSNALLHAPESTGTLHIDVLPGRQVRIAVEDANPAPPLPRKARAGGTTGRGLSLVLELSRQWGVERRTDGAPGKVVWALLAEAEPVAHEPAEPGEPDVEALLALWPDEAEDAAELVTIEIGDAPTALLLEAKEHLDGLVREVTLAAAGDAAGVNSRMPPGLAEAIAHAVHGFDEVRRQLRRLGRDAAARGDERVRLVVHVHPNIAGTADAYLQALAEADQYARDARLLTLESPVEYRVLRQWYGETIIAEARRLAAGAPPAPLPTFEQRLVAELRTAEARLRSTELSARLQRVTAELATAEHPEDIASIVVRAGTETLGASGGMVATLGPDLRMRPYAETGDDEGLTLRYRDLPGDPHGPSRSAMLSGQAVYLESAEERDARFPHLTQVQPDAVSVAAIPLKVAGEVVGVLRFSFPTARIFDSDERAYLIALGGQTGLAVGRIRALGELQQLRDELELLLASGQLTDPAKPDLPELLSAPTLASVDIALLRTLYGDAPIGIAVLDTEGRYLRVNQLIADAHRGRPGEQIGMSLEDALGLFEGGKLRERLNEVVRTGRPITEADVRMVDGHGVPRAWRSSFFPVRGSTGRVDAVLVIAADVTGQQWAEELRRRAEERNRVLALTGALFSEALDVEQLLSAVCDVVVPLLGHLAVVLLADPGGQLEFAALRHQDPITEAALEPMLERASGSASDVFGAMPVMTSGHASNVPAITAERLEEVCRRRPEIADVMRTLGPGAAVIVPLVARGRTLGTMTLYRSLDQPADSDDVELLEDIGRRAGLAIANAQALASSVRLDLALSAADMGSFAWQLSKDAPARLGFDDRMCTILGVDPSSWTGNPNDFYDLVVPEDQALLRDLVDHAIATCGELTVNFRVKVGDAPIRWVGTRGRAVAGPDGVATQLLGTAVDATELRESRDKVVRALEHMADAFISLDRDWRYTYVNMAAENMIGRRRDDLLGRSFWDVFPEVLGTRTETMYRRAMSTDVMTQFDVHYGRLDKYFEARVFPTPDGVSVHFSDVGSQRRAEMERDRANARVAVLDRIGEAVAETLDVDEALSRLADALVPGIATLVTIDLRASGENRSGGAMIVVGSSVEEVTAMREAEAIHPRRLNPRSAVYRVIHGGAPSLIHDPLKHLGPTLPVSEEQLAHWLKVPIRSAIVVPLVGRGRILGAITLMRTRSGPPVYTDDDLTLAIEIGRRAGVMIDNAAQYTTQRKLAETLQRSLLPELPAVSGIELVAHYEPSSAEAKVGGDWYDAFPLPGSGLGLVIGDVMGHDIAAATAMGQLRSVLRTCAVDGDPPSEVLDRLDRLVDSFAMADLATVVYARLDRHADGSATMVYANAGHPPPLLVTADGRGRFLREASSTMIGAPGAGSHAEAVVHLPPGAIVLMFTDGLVERRRADLGERLEVFRHVTEAMWEAHSEITGFAAGIMTEMQRDSESDDDAALLAIRVRPA